MLARLTRAIVPAATRRTVKAGLSWLESFLWAGDEFECPICEGAFWTLMPYGRPPRPNARCPRCGSFERHRLLWLYLRARTDFFTARLRVLDVAPVAAIQRRCLRLPNLDYLSIDLKSPVAMRHMDVTDLELEDARFDCVLCYHVLEHVPRDRRAMQELFRVLKPGGWAILQVPVDGRLATTLEDPTVMSEQERLRVFGNRDHVRRYGRDYPDRLRAAGFVVEPDWFGTSLDPARVARYAISRGEAIYRCTRPRV
jgi:SAM-dependent methyltransferase